MNLQIRKIIMIKTINDVVRYNLMILSFHFSYKFNFDESLSMVFSNIDIYKRLIKNHYVINRMLVYYKIGSIKTSKKNEVKKL